MRRALALAAAALLWLPYPVLAQEPTSAEDEAASEEVVEAIPEEPRVSFNVRLDEGSGGGRVVGTAGDFDFNPGQSLIATGGVELEYRDLTLTAETVRLDIPDNSLTAEGDVVLDEGPDRISGSVLEYDLDTRTGRVTNAKAQVQGDIFFTGSEIAKTGDITYTIENGEFTSCEGENPAWSFALSDASITLEEYARIRNARLRFGKVPVLYFPYILWPATTERASGWLIPRPGYSDRRGAHIGLAYYRTLGRSADMTFYLDASTKEFFGGGIDYRYTPSENTNGVVKAYYLTEPDSEFADALAENRVFDPTREAGDDRWKLTWAHETRNLWNRFRGVVNLQLYSDFDYLRDVERNFDRQTRSYTYSNAFLSANEGPHSFNLMVDQRELINSNRTRNTRRQLPELEYRLRPTQLGSLPVYFSLQSSANAFQVEFEPTEGENAGTKTTIEYGRADFAPAFSIPLSTVPWLSVKATLAGRVTYYTDSLADPTLPADPDNTDVLPGGSLTRTFPSARLDVVGPSLSRVFELSGERFSKVKHIVEPRFTYTWVDDFDDRDRISVFDEIDTFRPQNATQVALVNRFLAKPRDEEEGGAFEIASVEVSKVYVFDDFDDNDLTDPVDGPIVTTVRVNPSEETSFKGEWRYDDEASELISQSLSGGTTLGRHGVGLTWFTRWNTLGVETSNQIRLFTKFEIIPDKLFFDAQIGYNLLDGFDTTNPELDRLQEQRYVIDYRSQCYSWLLEYRETNYSSFEDSELRFSLSLKNVGTFLDINESFD
ncbi:MAG: LPS assembly protein LptD [Acidobacteriota bacterium]